MAARDIIIDKGKFSMNRVFKIAILNAFLIAACQVYYPDQFSSNKVATLTSVPAETFTQTQTAIEVIPSVTPTLLNQSQWLFDLPHWVKHSFPGGILALPYKEFDNVNPSKVVFINPEDGDKFFVELSNEFYYYYWGNSENLVFFHEGDCGTSPKSISNLNVTNGYLQKYTAEAYSEKIQNCYSNSYDEMIRLDDTFSERMVEYIDPSSGEVFQLTDPEDGITDISVQMSLYKSFVAVVQFVGEFKLQETESFYGNKISIFDLKNKKLILQYYEEQGISPDISFIDDSSLAYMRENTPCLILIYSQIKKCIYNIANRFPNSTIILSQHTYHDGQSLRFLSYSEHNGGYCSYNLFSGQSGCVADSFSLFNNRYITNYSLSYYGHYILLEYSDKECVITLCDHPGSTYLALINQEGELFELGSSDTYYLSNLFRPLRPNPWLPWDF